MADFENLAKNVFDSNLISYSSITFTVKNLSKIPRKMRAKAIQQFCNEHDLKDDSERKLTVFNNSEHPSFIKRLSGKKSNF